MTTSKKYTELTTPQNSIQKTREFKYTQNLNGSKSVFQARELLIDSKTIESETFLFQLNLPYLRAQPPLPLLAKEAEIRRVFNRRFSNHTEKNLIKDSTFKP